MPIKSIKISVLLFALFSGLVDSCWAMTQMNGSAELAYVKYDAEVGGNEIFSGSSLAQRYSLTYTATNMVYRSQPRYYDLNVSYNWMGFKTKAVDLGEEINLKQSSSSFSYGGGIRYSTPGLPISFAAQINTSQPMDLTRNLTNNNLIHDDLVIGMSGTDKSLTSGFQFEFEPARARNLNIQGLPRLLVDYRESTYKSTASFNPIYSKTRELAVAGLNKENNWVHYRSVNYENYLNPLDKLTRQQIQIGLVDNLGQRKWAYLTNWIEASADGQLTQTRSPVSVRNLEEYDINLMMTAIRRTWDARTFMNYNRQLNDVSLIEEAKVPLYIKGIYGLDTNWYLSLATTRRRDRALYATTSDTSAMNSISAGGTTFTHSSFTLSPAVSLETGKSPRGIDSYSFSASLATESTRRFSDRLGLFGKMNWRNMNDGFGTVDSKTWSGSLDLKAVYYPDIERNTSYTLLDTVEFGKGAGYLLTERDLLGANNVGNTGEYFRNYLQFTARWAPTAKFSTSLEGAYDVVMSDNPKSDVLMINYRAMYGNNITTLTYGSGFRRLDTGLNVPFYSWSNTANISYRPDRNSDGSFQLSHSLEGANNKSSKFDLLQRYNYKFFTRNGINRILATLTEEYSYSRLAYNSANSPSGQYLSLSGRYNPTERTSIYGSVKFNKDTYGSLAMIYNAGMNADFKLLSASLDYTYAKRDSDNRLEKKLAASVRRSF